MRRLILALTALAAASTAAAATSSSASSGSHGQADLLAAARRRQNSSGSPSKRDEHGEHGHGGGPVLEEIDEAEILSHHDPDPLSYWMYDLVYHGPKPAGDDAVAQAGGGHHDSHGSSSSDAEDDSMTMMDHHDDDHEHEHDHEHSHDEGADMDDDELMGMMNEGEKTKTYASLMALHVLSMTIAFFGVLPLGIMLRGAKHYFHPVAQLLFLALVFAGWFFSTLYTALTPDLYEGQKHGRIGYIILFAVVAIACADFATYLVRAWSYVRQVTRGERPFGVMEFVRAVMSSSSSPSLGSSAEYQAMHGEGGEFSHLVEETEDLQDDDHAQQQPMGTRPTALTHANVNKSVDMRSGSSAEPKSVRMSYQRHSYHSEMSTSSTLQGDERSPTDVMSPSRMMMSPSDSTSSLDHHSSQPSRHRRHKSHNFNEAAKLSRRGQNQRRKRAHFEDDDDDDEITAAEVAFTDSEDEDELGNDYERAPRGAEGALYTVFDRDEARQPQGLPAFLKMSAGRSLSKLQRLRKAGKKTVYLAEWLVVYLAYVATVSGGVVYGGICRGSYMNGCLAHLIKGSIFFLYGLLTFCRYLGAFAKFGWSWNRAPLRQKFGPDGKVTKSNPYPTAEMIECSVIFFYGITNTWLERTGAQAGDPYTTRQIQHISIAVMFWFAGLIGMALESRTVRRLLSFSAFRTGSRALRAENEPVTYTGSFNPFPALVIGVTGVAMAAHHQTYRFAVQVHSLWGNMLGAFAVLRCLTYIFLWVRPPTGERGVVLPSRPPTEALASFFLTCGGLVFIVSTEQIEFAFMRSGHDDIMMILNAVVALVCFIFCWCVVVLAIKGWAQHSVAVRRHGSRMTRA